MSKAPISILVQAQDAIDDRRKRVDGPVGNFERIAKVWSVVFGHAVSARDVALCMIGLKFARQCYAHWTDNLVDICGYADCLALIEGDYDAKATVDVECNGKGTAEFFKEWRTAIGQSGRDIKLWTGPEDPEAEVSSPAPWQGRFGRSDQSDEVTRNAESDAWSGRHSEECACGKSPGHCDWPTCSEYKAPTAAATARGISGRDRKNGAADCAWTWFPARWWSDSGPTNQSGY